MTHQRSSLVNRFAVLFLAAPVFPLTEGASAQVHYYPDGRPWNQKAREGPDAAVNGWYYGLGVTGLRVQLDEERPSHLLVKHVFEGSPAHKKVKVGDWIVGAGGARFETPHRNGYGMNVFGPQGPMADFAAALDAGLAAKKNGHAVVLVIDRNGKEKEVKLKLPAKSRAYAESFPFDCKEAEARKEFLLEYLMENQRDDGSFGHPVHNTFAPLALLSSGKSKHMKAAAKAARFHAQNTKAEDEGGLINWRYMAAGLVLAEYYFATEERWVLPELEEVYTFIKGSQYMDPSQINPKAKESHPGSYPKSDEQQRGGWGHITGFEGYGPIAMLTGEGALVYSLMKRAGIEVDEEQHRAAYAFLDRGTGSNGYLWYADGVAGDENWADMGRTGASTIAHWMSPFDGHESFAKRSAALMGDKPDSFPDTHGSPLLGMAYGALGAAIHRPSFEKLMAANRWWFVLSECPDGTFHYQPNRDNAGYGNDARLLASCVTAFILSIPDQNLVVTGKDRAKRPATSRSR